MKYLILLVIGFILGRLLFHLEKWFKKKLVLWRIKKSLRLKPIRVIIGNTDGNSSYLKPINTGFKPHVVDGELPIKGGSCDDVGHTMIIGEMGSDKLTPVFRDEADKKRKGGV